MHKRLLIKHGILALPTGPTRCDVLCEGGRVVAVGGDLEADGAHVIEAHGLHVGPGFVDIHVHGGGGFSFFQDDPAHVVSYAGWAPRNGVTSFLISTVGPNAQETEHILSKLARAILGPGPGAEPLGIHLEGPFISPDRRGAFHPDMLREPAREEFWRYQEAAGEHIRQVTFAPELPRALELAAAIVASGAVAAMGHTDASVAEARAGFESGVRHVTHLFNAMRPLHQREGGPLTAALLEDRVTCELVCDGAHVVPDLLRLAFRVLGPSRFVTVTDNLQLAGSGRLASEFAGYPIQSDGFTARRPDGTIVGSVATMDHHFRTVVDALGIDLHTAFRLCSTNPARVIGAGSRKGSLHHGMDADIVMLDGGLNVVSTICRGEVAFNAEPARARAR